MSFFGAAAALNSTFALSNVVHDLYVNNVDDWRYASNTAWWASNSLSNYNKAADQIYGSNTASWVSNSLSNYALSNGQSNWNWASNTAKYCSNTLSNYALLVFQSNWVFASNTAQWTSNHVCRSDSNWNFASNTATWASNKVNWTSNALPNYMPIYTQSNLNYASNTVGWASNEIAAREADWDYVSNLSRWTSNALAGYALSNGQSNWNWASNMAKWASNEVGTRRSNWDYGSNTANWASNMTQWASNEIGTRDSNWDYGSNTARWASNEVGTRDSNWDYASNMASWGSNAAKWASNEVGMRDSNWDYGSNTARWASNEIGTRDSNWDYASNTARWGSNEVGTRDSNWDYGSNTARWASNNGQWASNEIGKRDSNWDYASNTARWASNYAMSISNDRVNWTNVNGDPPLVNNPVASYGAMTYNMLNSNVAYIDYTGRGALIVNNAYLSNTARWACNTAIWSSNEIGTRDSNWDYASNTARWGSNAGGWASNNLAWASNTAAFASNSGGGRVMWSNVNLNPPTTGNPTSSYGKMVRNMNSETAFYIDYNGTAYPTGISYWDHRVGGMGTLCNVFVGSWDQSRGGSAGFEVSFVSSFNKSVNFGYHSNITPPANKVVISDPHSLLITTTSATKPAIEFYSHSAYQSGSTAPFAQIFAFDALTTYSPANAGSQKLPVYSIIVQTFSGSQYTGSSTLGSAFDIRPDNDGRVTMWGYRDGSYRFELGVDSAAKPGSGQWAVTSDERVKENIVLADLDLCYDNVKRIPLKHFMWKYEHFDEETIYDRRKLGWIAQDVEKVFKKAVRTNPNHPTVPNCKSLDADQLYACMYGAIQKLQEMCETMQARIDVLEAERNAT